LDNCRRKIRLSHITAKGGGFAAGSADSCRRFTSRGLIQIADDEAGAVLGQQFSRSRANPAPAASHNSYFAFN
jgi:hypothetical protein